MIKIDEYKNVSIHQVIKKTTLAFICLNIYEFLIRIRHAILSENNCSVTYIVLSSNKLNFRNMAIRDKKDTFKKYICFLLSTVQNS